MAQIKNVSEVRSNRLFTGIYDPQFNFKDKNYINIKEGDVVYSRGDKSEYMYLVVSGRVKLKTYENPRQPKVFLVSRNEFFGEKEIIDKTVRNSSAVAEKDTNLFRISNKDFLKLCSNRKVLDNLNEQKYEEVIPPSRKTDLKEDIFKRIINDSDPVIKKERGIELKDYSNENPLLEMKARDEINEELKMYDDDDEGLELKDSDILVDDDGVTWDFDLNDLKEEGEHSKDTGLTETENDNTKVEDSKDKSNFLPEDETDEEKDIVDNFFKMQEQVNELSDDLDKAEDLKPDISDIPQQTESIPDKKELNSDFIAAVLKITSVTDKEETDKLILEGCTELVNAETAILYFPDKDGILKGKLFEDETEVIAGYDSIPGKCYKSGEVINIKDVFNDSNFNPTVDYISYFHIHSLICVPIQSEENVKAVLQLFNSRNGEFSEYDEKLLSNITPLILRGINLYEKQDLNQEPVAAELAEEKLTDQTPVEEVPPVEEKIAELIKEEEAVLSTPGTIEKQIPLRVLSDFLLQEFQVIVSDIKQFNKYLQKIDIPGETKEVSDVVTNQTSKIIDLLEVLRDYSEPAKVLNADKNSYISVFNEMVNLLAEYTEGRKVNLYKRFEEDADIAADPKSLYLAVFQLIKYQCDLMPFGGNIFISSSKTENSIEILLKNATKKTDESLVIPVQMDYNEDTPSGLGLSLAKKIIEDHSAILEVKNHSGTGMEIGILFPIT